MGGWFRRNAWVAPYVLLGPGLLWLAVSASREDFIALGPEVIAELSAEIRELADQRNKVARAFASDRLRRVGKNL